MYDRLIVINAVRGVLVLAAVLSLGACRHSPAGVTESASLVVALTGNPGSLNPAVTTSGNTHLVADQIFNGLVGLDEQFQPVPELAERWDVEDGGRVYRFALRPGVVWHDGVPLTAGDVKFTFQEALLKYHSRTRAALEPLLASIHTPDDLTVVFNLKAPYPALPYRLDVVEAPIIPRHVYEGQDLMAGPASRRPVGTGPFRFVSYIPDDRVVLERNREYFRKGMPGVDRLTFRVLPNASTAIAALEKGEVDFVNTVPGPDAARLRGTRGIAVEATVGGAGGSACQDVLIPNLARPALADLRVRRAIAHAIDRRFIVDRVYFGQGRPATGPIHHMVGWAYTRDVRQYEYDPDKARRLLDEAGWPGQRGEGLTLTFTYAAGHERLGLSLREQLKAAGVTLVLESLDFNAAVDKVFAKKAFDLGVASYCNGADPDVGVRRVYVSSNIGPFPFSNGAGYRNPRIDDLFDRASREPDRARRRALYVEIQRLLADDVPYFWLIDSQLLRAYRSSFTGFRLWTGAFCESVRHTRAPAD